MPYRICKTFEIENGHMLSKHPDLCKFPHGHSRVLTLEGDKANRALEESRTRVRFRRDRTRSFEWLGTGEGLRQLHQDMLGDWDREKDFWSNTNQLRQLEGVASYIKGPEAGDIELP